MIHVYVKMSEVKVKNEKKGASWHQVKYAVFQTPLRF